MASYPEGFGSGLWQWQNNKTTLGLLFPAVEGGRAATQCDGTAATCSPQSIVTGEDFIKGLLELSSNAKKPLFRI